MGEIVTFGQTAAYWNKVGLAAESRQAWDEAAAAFRRAGQLEADSVPAWLGLGRALQQLGDLEHSEEAVLKAVELDQHCLDAWSHLAGLCAVTGRRKQHRFCLGWIISLDPANAEARAELAQALEEAGEGWRAKRYWLEVLRTVPDGPLAERARRHLDGA